MGPGRQPVVPAAEDGGDLGLEPSIQRPWRWTGWRDGGPEPGLPWEREERGSRANRILSAGCERAGGCRDHAGFGATRKGCRWCQWLQRGACRRRGGSPGLESGHVRFAVLVALRAAAWWGREGFQANMQLI